MKRIDWDKIDWDAMEPHERTALQRERCNQRVAEHLDNELREIEPFVDPAPSFVRGAQFGALAVGAFNLFFPGMFGVAEWPQPVRVVLGIAFLTGAAHLIMRQHGFMKAQRINRSLKV